MAPSSAEAAAELAAALASHDWQDLSLASGAAGAAVALHDLQRAGVEVPVAGAGRCLDIAVEGLAATALTPGLYSGFTGIGWAVAHVEGGGGLDEVDDALARWLDGAPPADLTHGAVGAGVYALEAGAPELLARAVELAGAAAAGLDDLGMAHGLAGVVALLAAAGATGPLRPAVERLLTHERDFGFPSHASSNEPSRLAWCYGDLGVAIALRRAAVALADEPLCERAGAVAVRAAARRESTGVRDASVCHGAAGAAHLLRRLGFEDAREHWTSVTLAMRRPGEGVGGYTALVDLPGAPVALADSGLLLGSAGVALVLAGATGWDRFLLV